MQAPSTAPRPSPLSPLATLLLVTCAAVCVFWFIRALGYWEDDAWIHLEFARSVAAGRGFQFNGAVVYGDTSPLWVWLLVAAHAVLPLSWLAAGKVLTAAAALFALTGIFFFARSLAAPFAANFTAFDPPASNPVAPASSHFAATPASTFAALMVLVTVVEPYFGYWAFSGMEALAAAGLVCWGCLALSLPPFARTALTPARFLLGALAAGIAPLLRPEMSFFTVLLGLGLLYRWWTLPGLRRSVPLLLAGLVLAAAPSIAWARYALHTFGSITPNTNAAKRAAPGDSVLSRLLHLYGFGFPVVLLALLFLAGWWFWNRRARHSRPTPHLQAALLPTGGWLLFLWTAINVAFYGLNHTFVQTRYIFVTAPVLTIALLALLLRLSLPAFRALTAFALVYGIAVSLLATVPLVRNKVQLDRDYADLAAFLRTLPPDAPVAHYSIGEAAFLSEHPIIDIGGITRPGIIPFLWDAGDARRLAWMRSEGARYVITVAKPTRNAQLIWSRDVPSTGWYLNPRAYRATDPLHVWTLPPAPPATSALHP